MSPKVEETATSYASESKKIWITLTAKYSDILDVLADDTPDKKRSNRKSVLIEKMVDEYLEKHEKELSDDGKWYKIISIRKKAANSLEKSLEEKIEIVDIYLDNFSDLDAIKDLWLRFKAIRDIDNIDKIYNKVRKKQELDAAKLDSILKNL